MAKELETWNLTFDAGAWGALAATGFAATGFAATGGAGAAAGGGPPAFFD